MQPLASPCDAGVLAEAGGFEPPVACTTPVFKTGAFGRSATPPWSVGERNAGPGRSANGSGVLAARPAAGTSGPGGAAGGGGGMAAPGGASGDLGPSPAVVATSGGKAPPSCGTVAASRTMLLFRSGTLGYLDLNRTAGTENFGGIRPGCWFNAIPAGGLVLVPDGSSNCACSYQMHAWLALQPAE